MFEKLFEPMKIGTLEIKNRFVVPAMDSHYTNEEHHFTDRAFEYYAARAKGGFGLIMTEFICVSEEGLAEATQAAIYDDTFIPSLSRLTERVHQEDGKIFAQIHHAGRIRGEGTSTLPPVGASALPMPGKKEVVHELTTDEVIEVVQKFIAAAVRAQAANFDGVEIHGAHGYLLADFLSKGVNKRSDEYGGNITNRGRIVAEIIQGIKKACGQDFPVTVRTSGDEAQYGYNNLEDAKAQALLFQESGADAVHISYGVAIQSNYIASGFNIPNAKAVKECLDIPVIVVGRINDPMLANSVVASGNADFVALGRQSICDSDFVNKVKENRINELLTCTGCMQRCLYTSSFEEGEGTSCMINPFSGKESTWVIETAEEKKKILVVGAGVGGLQASWILAKRGHEVTLAEKSNFLGGQYRLASIPPMKQDLVKTVLTYAAFCEKYGVRTLKNTFVDEQFIADNPADVIVVSTGSVPIVPRIEGIENENVYLANDILASSILLQNKKVLVLGAGLVGAETAELLGEYGNDVTIMDMLDSVAPLAMKRPRLDLLARLEKHRTNIMLESKVIKINEDGVDYQKDDQQNTLNGYDAIVLAFGSKPNNQLYELMKQKHPNVHSIGDSDCVADAKKAIYDATKLALEI